MASKSVSRRIFLQQTTAAAAAIGLSGLAARCDGAKPNPLYKISLAEWSINKPLFAGKIDHLDFPKLTKQHGIEAVEYVNQFFMDKAQDQAYLQEMKTRADGEGVESVLIMCDREGLLGDADEVKRMETVNNHKKWVEAAKFLGCHAIRVNAYSSVAWSKERADFMEAQKLVADGLRRLCEYAQPYDISVIIENHGGFSSNGQWLVGLMQLVDHPMVGTLPDFGNFRIHQAEDGTVVAYDSYRGVEEMMPYAKGVSVKTKVFDDEGQQHSLDYSKMLKIVTDADYHGYCGIEYGEAGREWESIVEVKEALLQTRAELGA